MASTPDAPDPYATAQAQAGFNQSTATTQQLLNMVDQQGPWGSTSYTQNGSTGFTDSFGNQVNVPRFTQTTTYSPDQQAIFDKTTQTKTNLADLATDQSAMFKDYLADPFKFDNNDASNWAFDLGSQRILPQQAQATEALKAKLVNSGLRPGTAAYEREMTRLGQNQGDQLNQLALQGRGQAFNEAAYERSAPINELSALLSGSQVAGPNSGFSAAPQTSVGGVDYSGLVSSNYQAELANSQSALGGLFGLAGSLGGAAIRGGI